MSNYELEDLVLTGAANINGFGNALNNRLTGNSGNNYLQGFTGLDTLAGGAGNDYYELGDRSASVVAGLFYDTVIEGAAAGTDFVNVTPYVSSGFESYYTLGANIENGGIAATMAFNLIGNGLNNALTGNTASTYLSARPVTTPSTALAAWTGCSAAPTMTLTFSPTLTNTLDLGYRYDTVTEDAGAGTDTAVVTAIDNPDTAASIDRYTLGANIENGTIAGGLAFNLAGNGLNNG